MRVRLTARFLGRVRPRHHDFSIDTPPGHPSLLSSNLGCLIELEPFYCDVVNDAVKFCGFLEKWRLRLLYARENGPSLAT